MLLKGIWVENFWAVTLRALCHIDTYPRHLVDPFPEKKHARRDFVGQTAASVATVDLRATGSTYPFLLHCPLEILILQYHL